MTKMKEKLTRLIESCEYDDAEELAVQLMAKGVGVLEWVPVDDKEPRVGAFVLCYIGEGVVAAKYLGEDRWFTGFAKSPVIGKKWITHWMYLPEVKK